MSTEDADPKIKIYSDLPNRKNYIGSGAVFDLVSNTFSFSENGLDEIYQISRFLEDLCEQNHEDIGGKIIVTRGKNLGFKHIPILSLKSPRYTPPSTNSWHTVDFGSAQSGGFAYTTVTPKLEGENGYGFYYFQGKFGEYYYSDLKKDTLEHLVLKSDSLESFIQAIQKETGQNLEWCGELK